MQSVLLGFEGYARQRVSCLDHLHDVQARLVSCVPWVQPGQVPPKVQQVGQSDHETVDRLLHEQSVLPDAG